MAISLLKLIGGFGMIWALARLCLEWADRMPFLQESLHASAEWAIDVYGVLSAPSHPSTLVILSASVGLVGLLLYVEKRKSRRGQLGYGGAISEAQSVQESWNVSGRAFPNREPIPRSRVNQEWESLEEEDREVIREIVLQGGLMESDIKALLKARGFIQYEAAYEPIADRVKCIHCDFAGYHSIVPAYQSSIHEKVREELRDESIANERR